VAGSGSGGSQFRDIAIGLALGILMDTFLVRTLLVPSTVVLLGRWNWWPSRMSRAGAQITEPEPVPTPASALDPAEGTKAGGEREPRQPDPLH
jgi:putative drug exporter of the RND superfamily